MGEPLNVETVLLEQDSDRLWQELKAAKSADNHVMVRAIENRMRELGDERRYAHLADEELDRRIASLTAQRGSTGMLAHSPPEPTGGSPGDTMGAQQANEAIRKNQHVGLEETLSRLLAERARRGR